MKSRLVACLGLLLLWVVLAGMRLVRLQVREHDEYFERAGRQQMSAIELTGPRGTIFDAQGRELAVSVTVESAFARPARVEDPEATATTLAQVLGVSRAAILKRLQSEAGFVWIQRQLDHPVATQLRELDLRGIDFVEESRRYYPQRELAGAVLGFVGVDNEGLGGLEALYESTLAGGSAQRRVLRDARHGTLVHPDLAFREPEPGEDLHLALDSAIQYIVERELQHGVESNHAKAGSAVVLDPLTGAVLAMASYPAFDPNEYRKYAADVRRNRPVMDAYEPGSTFKLITAAAALEADLIDPQDVFDCEHGSIVVYGKRIRDHKSFGDLTFREVIAKSSNVGTIKAGLLVGPERLHRQLTAFGFGVQSAIDMPGESSGLVWPLSRWNKRSVAYVSFGQELSVTPLQMTNAFAAIANGGSLYEPFVVSAIGKGNGRRAVRERGELRGTPIQSSTARSLGRMLEAVVAEGTGKQAAIPGYRVGGKTGTAEKASPSGGYADGLYVASFVGFAPTRDARVVCLVAVDEPRGSRQHGGDVAAGVFSNIVQQTLLYLGIAPDDQDRDRWPGEDETLTAEASQSLHRIAASS